MLLIVVPTWFFNNLISCFGKSKGGTNLYPADLEVEELGGPNDSTSGIIDNSASRIPEHTDTYTVADDKLFDAPCHHSWYSVDTDGRHQ